MSDKFSIDDILAEIGSDNDVSKKTAKSSGVADKKAPSQSKPGATMILNSIDEKKKTQGKENTIEISAENLQHLKGVVGEGQRRPKESAHQTQKTAESPKVNKPDSDVHYKSLSEFEDDEKPVKHRLNASHDSVSPSKPSKEKPAVKAAGKQENKSQTIFGKR